MQLTNFTVNRTADNIAKSMVALDIEKARHGVYADTEENRRLRRVGQEYGKAGQKEEPSGRQDKKPEEGAEKKPAKREEEKGGKKPAKQKEELFSKNGMLGPDGKLNPKSEHVKRMYELEKKVDSGKATPEEKQEYATLRNQAKNESERHVHEGRKQFGVNEKEPKYKTVDERRAEYKAQKDKKAEEAKETPEMKAMKSNHEAMHTAALSNYAVGKAEMSSSFRSRVFKENLKQGTPEYEDALGEVVSEALKFQYDQIAQVAEKYGAENLANYISKMGTMEDDNTGEVIAKSPMTKNIAQRVVFDACAHTADKQAARKEYKTALDNKAKTVKAVIDAGTEYAKNAVENYGMSWEPDYGDKITDPEEVAKEIANALWDVKDIHQDGGSQYYNKFEMAWDTKIANHLSAGLLGSGKMMKMKNWMRNMIEYSIPWQEAQEAASLAQAAIDDAKKKLEEYGIEA